MPLRDSSRCPLLPALAAIALLARTALAEDLPPYKDSSLPFEKRVADLLSRMTFAEKADQMQVVIPANPRLGIPACKWGTEAMHGLPGGGTMFPDSMALAATFDPPLIHQIASAIGDEARARSNPSAGAAGAGSGIILWCPNLNLARDPRWGRNMETYGEDPFLAGRLGIAYVKGLQGDDPKYLKTLASPKHFAVYSQEQSRTSSNAYVSQRALHEYYLKPFQAAIVDGGALSTMSAFNAINSVPCSANEWLLTTLLRDDWGFQGAVCTDNGAVSQIYTAHRYTDSDEKAVAAAINAGVDVITGNAGPAGAGGAPIGARVTPFILAAQEQNLFKPGAVDRAVTNSLMMRFKLGMFDPPEKVPFASIPPSVVGSPEHVQLALQSAREAITLLQNKPAPKGYGFDKLLPLDLRRIESIAIVGPNASINLYGSYSGGGMGPNGTMLGTGSRGPTPAEALKMIVGDRILIRTALAADTDASLDAARTSDLVLFFGGLDTRMDRANIDRTGIDLPYDQVSLLDKVSKVNPLVVAILTGGSTIGLEQVKEKTPALLMYWYDGEQGGNALAEVLVGRANPAGRLPLTFYKALADVPPIDDYELTHGRTYQYLSKPVTFPFGHGLSYTTFTYENFKLAAPPAAGGDITATLDITNTGPLDGDEVVQLYAHKTESTIPRPLRQLVAFQRLHLAKGETRTVTFTVPSRELALWDTNTQKFTVDPGTYEFTAAASSEDIRQKSTLEIKQNP